jgi:zinc D-Ala-D-Ala carboxypeptidase
VGPDVFRQAGAVCAVLAACVLSGTTVAAAAPAPQAATPVSPSPTPASRGITDAGVDESLGQAELAAQIAAADRLREDLLSSNAQIAAATTRLERLALQANELLQQYARARDAERTAREEADRNLALFEEMNAQATDDRRALGAWAFHVYTGGGSLADLSAILDALTSPASEAIDPLAHLDYLSDQRTHALERIQSLAADQQVVALKAVDARSAATVAALQAADARRKLDAVIAKQKRELDSTRALHAEQVKKVGPISGLLLGSEDERALNTTRELRKALALPELFADGSSRACDGDDADYPNGHIPAKALCGLYQAPGESLRPRAAAAFNALSKAYEHDTGSPVCVTDSYRSLAEQVSVKAAKGKWAATPGTSEHGLGLALDLCGGIEDFGSPAHLWMRQNAPLYGWFHPAWAQSGGSLPEPWHWEYAG